MFWYSNTGENEGLSTRNVATHTHTHSFPKLGHKNLFLEIFLYLTAYYNRQIQPRHISCLKGLLWILIGPQVSIKTRRLTVFTPSLSQASLSGHAPKDQAYSQILEHVYNQLRNMQWWKHPLSSLWAVCGIKDLMCTHTHTHCGPECIIIIFIIIMTASLITDTSWTCLPFL